MLGNQTVDGIIRNAVKTWGIWLLQAGFCRHRMRLGNGGITG